MFERFIVLWQILKYVEIALAGIWLHIPAALANMAPIVAKLLIPKWNTPVDFGLKYHGKEILGSHKTYRGMVTGTLIGAIAFMTQRQLFSDFEVIRKISLFDYSSAPIFFGAWIGFCALTGDLVKSFFKRQVEIKPGSPWIPFDEIDWILGSLAGLTVIYIPSVQIVVVSVSIYFLLNFLTSFIGFRLGIKSSPL